MNQSLDLQGAGKLFLAADGPLIADVRYHLVRRPIPGSPRRMWHCLAMDFLTEYLDPRGPGRSAYSEVTLELENGDHLLMGMDTSTIGSAGRPVFTVLGEPE